jgi:hypothetical protein
MDSNKLFSNFNNLPFTKYFLPIVILISAMSFLRGQNAAISITNIATSGNELTFTVMLTPGAVKPLYLGDIDIHLDYPSGNVINSSIPPVKLTSAFLPNSLATAPDVACSTNTAVEVACSISTNGKIINYSPANLNSVMDIDQCFFNTNIAKVNGTVSLGTFRITFNSPFVGPLSCSSTISHLAYNFANTSTWAQTAVSTPTCGEGLTARIKVFLEGPFNTLTNKMNDDLRTLNILHNNVTSEPYSSTPYSYSNVGTTGGEAVPTSIFSTSGDNAIVDWIFVELRDAADINTVRHTRAALLQVDGDIVDVDGVSPVVFPRPTSPTPTNTYYIGIRHRNHLTIRTGNAYDLSTNPAIDFTVNNDNVTTSRMNIMSNFKVMRGGQANTDDDITASDVLRIRLSNNGTLGNFYKIEDINMSGQVTAADVLMTRRNNKAN